MSKFNLRPEHNRQDMEKGELKKSFVSNLNTELTETTSEPVVDKKQRKTFYLRKSKIDFLLDAVYSRMIAGDIVSHQDIIEEALELYAQKYDVTPRPEAYKKKQAARTRQKK